MIVSGLAVLTVILVLLQGEVFVLKLLVQQWTLLLIYAGNAVFFFYRAWAATRAFQIATPDPDRSRWTPLAGGLLLATVISIIVPHGAAAYYDLVQYDLLTSVFDSNQPVAAATSTTTTTVTVGSGGVGDGGSTSTTATTTTTTTIPVPIWEGEERLNVLLLGGDAGVGRSGIRTDTMIVLSLDPETGYAAMMSVPRNFAEMPAPPEWGIWPDDRFPDIANAIYQYGIDYPEEFPGSTDPGATAIKGSIEELMGIPIHYYALVNLDGFVDMIDAVGGVTITVTRAVHDNAYPHEDGTTIVVDIPVGTQKMDGHTALAYARSRRESSDYNRMGRQRCVLEALVEEASPATVLLRFGAIADAVKRSVVTDIPIEQLPNFVELIPILDTDQIVAVRFIPPNFNDGYNVDRFPIPNVAKIRSAVQTIINLPPAEAIAALDLVALDDVCGEETPEPAPTTSTTTAPDS